MQKERLSQRELARRSGIVPQRINDLLSERRRITADMSIKLEKALGIPHTGYFYIIQANHDVYLVEKQLQTHPIANTFRKELFWDTDKSGLDWVSNRQWIIQRVFSYGNDKIVEYSINIGPHQSNYISYEKSGTVNVNISHFGDVLSGNDAKGNVINIHSCMPGLNQHGNATFIPELEFVLPVLEAGGSKSDIKKRLTNLYQQWNKKHPGQFESTVE